MKKIYLLLKNYKGLPKWVIKNKDNLQKIIKENKESEIYTTIFIEKYKFDEYKKILIDKTTSDNYELYIILPLGSSYCVDNIDIVYKNINILDKYGINTIDVKNKDNLLKWQKSISTSLNMPDNKLELITAIIKLDTFNYIINNMMNDNEKILYEKSIIELEKLISNSEPQNELDIVTSLLNKYIGEDNIDSMKIESIKYNNKDMDSELFGSELYSHKFPKYLKEIDITTVKNHTFELNTNYGNLKKENGEYKFYPK